MKIISRFLVFLTPFIIIIGIIIIILVIVLNIQSVDFKCLVYSKEIILILFGIIGSFITINYHYVSSSKIEYETFTNCNRRFDEINEYLHEIIKDYENDKIFKDRNEKDIIEYLNDNKIADYNIILNYLDLCAEEYYLFKHQGVVSYKVWKHWFNGIKYYFDDKKEKNIFYIILKDESKKNDNYKDSYYGFLEYFEKMKNKERTFLICNYFLFLVPKPNSKLES